MRAIKIVIICSFLVLLSLTSSLSAQDKKRVAVLPFDNLSGSEGLGWLSRGIPVTVMADLRKIPDLIVLERTQLEKVLEEIRLGQAGVLDERTAKEAGKMLGADVVVLGEFQKAGDFIRITSRFVNVETGEVTGTAKVTGGIGEIFDLQDQLVFKISSILGISLTREEEGKIKGGKTKSLSAYEWSSKAWEVYDFWSGKGDADKAIRYLEIALEHDPNYVSAYNNLGVAYNSRGAYDKAIEVYQKALKIENNNAELYFNLGIAYDNRGSYQEAIKAYKSALALEPNDPKARNNLGVAYDNSGMVEEAIEEYLKVLKIDPDNIQAHNNLGIAYKEKGMYQEAIGEYEKVLAIDPNNTAAHYNLGLALFAAGEYERSAEEFTRVIELDKGYLSAYKNLGVLYEEKFLDKKKALAYYQQYLDLGGSDLRVYDWIEELKR
jgi:tetratricopeptide (TPR) repeat protein